MPAPQLRNKTERPRRCRRRFLLASRESGGGGRHHLVPDRPYMPLADNDYSYYAPLGVLVSTYPTLAGTARAGIQSLVGLALGIGLGLGGLGLVPLGLLPRRLRSPQS